MPDCADLEEKARNSPHNFDFGDLIKLAECFGFEKKRQTGSHRLYEQKLFPPTDTQRKHRDHYEMNFQPRGGQAKPSQVKDLLDAVDYYRREFPEYFPESND